MGDEDDAKRAAGDRMRMKEAKNELCVKAQEAAGMI